jgi:cytochrome b561
MSQAEDSAMAQQSVYSPIARQLHWITAGFVFVMIPVGVIMADRGARNVWDATTNLLYTNHKLAGFILMFILVARLGYRLIKGAPPDEPTLEPWQKLAAHVTHWAIYALLFGMVTTGWVGISLFDARDVFGLFKLPAIVSPNPDAAKSVFFLHKLFSFALVGLIAAHIGASLFHHFIRKDGVLRRMLPKKA